MKSLFWNLFNKRSNLPKADIGRKTTKVSYHWSDDGTAKNYYCGDFVYDGSLAVAYILTPNGQLTRNPTTGAYTSQYNIPDHLGNVRSVVSSSGTVLQSTNYYPFGLAFSDSNIASNRYLYNGKELEDYTLGTSYLGTLDYGARHYDPRIARWTVPDPMAEKYYGVNAYGYCAGDPVMMVDPNGNVIIFVNGFLGFGSPRGGASYWNNQFVSRAQQVLNDESVQFLDINYGLFSSAKSRESKGYEYANHYLQHTVKNLKEGESIKIVSHSMGAAFSEGIAKYLKENGYPIDILVHFEPYQANNISSVGGNKSVLSVDYQTEGDFIINYIKSGDMKDADVHFRAKSTADFLHIHRAAIDNSSSWDDIKKFIYDFLNSK